MALGFGYSMVLGVGEEGTYGTPVTRTDFLELNSESLAQADDVIESASVYHSEMDVDNFKQARKVVAGNIEYDLRIDGAEKMFKHALGTDSTTTMIEGAEGTAYKHTFSLADALPTGLSMEINRDAGVFLYHGCKLNTTTITQDNSNLLKISHSIIAEDEGTATSATSPSLSSSTYFAFHEAVISFAGTTQASKGFNLTLNNNLTADRYHLGSRLIKEPKRSGRIEVSGEMTVEFDGTTNWGVFQDAGTGSFSATWTGTTISGTATNEFKITCPYVRLSGGTPNVSDSGPIEVTIPFVAYANGTTSTTRSMYIEWTNEGSSV